MVWHTGGFWKERRIVMKMVKCLDQKNLIGKGIEILYRELGLVEARRFLTLTHPVQRKDSVKRHRDWQSSLDKDEFLQRIKNAHEKTGRK
jgi:hypothetical protein